MADRNEEKNRLWNEVFSKKRAYEKDTEPITELKIDADEKEKRSRDTILKNANDAMEELSNILHQQKKDLDAMHEELVLALNN